MKPTWQMEIQESNLPKYERVSTPGVASGEEPYEIAKEEYFMSKGIDDRKNA